ncbi:RagB/SusD family nutrient uptake outer membrane protein [Phycicoccus elongatus]|uniref:RagB/SusD family nutrient uptake outer membrane protein n=1 Tax=Phycicoccus elongatus TaxID=101689 RepID=UPI003D80E31F
MDEIVKQRRYSLFGEGHRWIDMRRWGRLNQLPIDRPGDDVLRPERRDSGQQRADRAGPAQPHRSWCRRGDGDPRDIGEAGGVDVVVEGRLHGVRHTRAQ